MAYIALSYLLNIYFLYFFFIVFVDLLEMEKWKQPIYVHVLIWYKYIKKSLILNDHEAYCYSWQLADQYMVSVNAKVQLRDQLKLLEHEICMVCCDVFYRARRSLESKLFATEERAEAFEEQLKTAQIVAQEAEMKYDEVGRPSLYN